MLNYYHPFTLLCYFVSILTFTMFYQNPILTLISLISGILFYLSLKKFKISYKDLIYNTVLFLLVTVTNPLFSHNGNTNLFFINNNAVTLESIIYGAYIGLMIICAIYWFKCFNLILTQEKIIFLFGKLSPKLAQVISSANRFIPMLKEQSSIVKNSQKALGLYATDNYLDKLKSNARAFSSVTTFALEKAIEMSQSMDSRGYGLKGRTYYSKYKFKLSDIIVLITILIFDITIILCKIYGKFDFKFYPSIKFTLNEKGTMLGFTISMILCLAPFIIKIREDIKWKFYKSKI